ncbi:MAG: OmpA family protein [Ekhidna sp.]
MKSYVRIIFVLFVALQFSNVNGQKIFKVYEEAEESFYTENFNKALAIYKSIVENDPAYEDVSYKIEICSLLTVKQYNSMDKFYEFGESKSKSDKFYYYWEGRIYMSNYEFEKAVESLKKFINLPAKKSDEIIAEARRWIGWAIAARKYMDNPMFYEIHLLDQGINTEKAELSPVFFADKEELLFLSNRNDSNPEEFQIYHTTHVGNREWSEPSQVPGLGTFTRDNANIEVVDEDGRLFQFRTDKGGDLFYSEPSEKLTGWRAPVEFDSKISSTHLSSHFFINEHEDRIIFAKNVGSKKKENLDLFQSFRNPESGDWSKPALFASSINSEFNEDSPYLSPDEKTLYFASDGHETMGGYDVFKSTFDSASLTWSEPINMGFPINTPDDEKHFKLNADQQSGYFTSNRLNTYGDFDIFFFWDIHTVKINGRIVNQETGEYLKDAKIYFRPYEYSDMYFVSDLDAKGKYSTTITADDIFKVEIIMKDGTIHTEDFEIHATGGVETTYLKDFYIGKAPQTEVSNSTISQKPAATKKQSETRNSTDQAEKSVTKRKSLQKETQIKDLGNKYRAGNRAITRNIYFDFGNTKVKDESIPTLSSIEKLLKDNPNMSIEIAGHTDSIGDAETNKWVSQARANAVMKWLIENGISKERLRANGYGEDYPLASNDDEEDGRELNRRIEIVRN